MVKCLVFLTQKLCRGNWCVSKEERSRKGEREAVKVEMRSQSQRPIIFLIVFTAAPLLTVDPDLQV